MTGIDSFENGSGGILEQSRRRVPLAIKVGVFVSVISVGGAIVLGAVGVVTTRARIDAEYADESSDLVGIISSQVMRHPEDFEETNTLLTDLAQTHPGLLRIRLFRTSPSGSPLIWASSYHTDLAVDADRSVLVAPGQRLQQNISLDGQPAFLDIEHVDYPNGVGSVAFYYRAGPREQAIRETGRRILIDSIFVMAVELLALILATYLLVLRRVKRLGRAATSVAEGDLSVRLPATGARSVGDELDDVARQFDNMVHAVEARTRQQAAVAELGRLALAGGDHQTLFDETTGTVADVLAADVVVLFELTDPETMTLRSGTGFPDGVVGKATTPAGSGSQAGYTLLTRDPVVVVERAKEDRFALSSFADRFRLVSGVTVIVGSLEDPFGVLGADMFDRRVFTSDDISFLQSVANVLAEALERSAALAREREAEERYRIVVENAADLIILASLETEILFASPSYEKILGYAPQEMVGRGMVEFVESLGGVEVQIRRAVLSGRTVPFADFRLLHRDGSIVYVDGTAAPILDEGGNVTMLLVICHDVTEQRAAREERRRLLARLMAAQEEERLRIAADIHDDPIQTMTAAALRLEAVRKLSDNPVQVEMLDKLEDSISRAIHRLRRLMFELRPPALDREGLAAALRDYLGNASRESSFAFGFESRLAEEPNPETRAIAFRVAKEALVNVSKHAQADRVDVLLDSFRGGLRVRIKDDGVGFDLTEAEKLSDHVGLTAMRERTSLAGGWCRIESSPGRGTTIEFTVPVQEETAADTLFPDTPPEAKD